MSKLTIKPLAQHHREVRYYVSDENGMKVFPPLGCTTQDACQAYVAMHDDPRDRDRLALAAWIEFNILREIVELESINPRHYLVIAVRQVCGEHGSLGIAPGQCELNLGG